MMTSNARLPIASLALSLVEGSMISPCRSATGSATPLDIKSFLMFERDINSSDAISIPTVRTDGDIKVAARSVAAEPANGSRMVWFS